MKNILSILLIVLLTAFMFACTTSPSTPPAPVVCDAWTVVSVTSSLSSVQPKFGQAVGGKFELPCTPSGAYALKTPAGVVTTGGAGIIVISSTTATEGNLVLDGKVTFAYSNLTATSMTLSGDVTAGSTPPASTQNIHTIVLKRP